MILGEKGLNKVKNGSGLDTLLGSVVHGRWRKGKEDQRSLSY